jgi:polysaccharide transporter, PST family
MIALSGHDESAAAIADPSSNHGRSMNKHGPFISSGFWSLSTQVVRVGSLATITIALSRHFGPQRFGALVVGLAFVRVFAVIATFGLDRIVVRHLVEQTKQAGAIVRKVFRLKLGIGLLSYITMLIFILTCERGDMLLLAISIFAGGSLLFQSCDIYDYAFQAQNRFALTFLGRGVPILLSTALKGVAILASAPLLVFAVLETVEAAVIGSALFLIYRRTHSPKLSIDPRTTFTRRSLLAEGLPLLVAALAVMIYMRSDVVLLGKIASCEAAGIYAAAAQISEACTLLPFALMPVLFPILVRWRRLGIDFYRHQFERLFLAAIFCGLAFSITLTFGAQPLVRFIFGERYLAASDVLVIHGWTIIFIFIGVVQGGYEVTEGLTWFGTAKTIIGAVLNIALNLALIPRYGAVGSAVATLVAQISSSILANGLHPRIRPILHMQLRSLLIWPVVRGLARKSDSSEAHGWQTA